MIAVSTSPYHLSMGRRFNTWYSIADGDFTNPQIWISNGTKKHSLPQPGDDVVINHTVRINATATMRNLTVNGKMNGDSAGKTLTITGNLNSPGVIDFTGSNIFLNLNGPYNLFSNFTAGSSTVTYGYLGDQQITPVLYNNLVVSSSGVTSTKSISADLIINGYLTVAGGCTFNIDTFNLSVGGSTSVEGGGSSLLAPTIKTASGYNGSIVFAGYVLFNTSNQVSLSGTPNIEFRNGVQMSGFGQYANLGAGIITFTTRNQTMSYPEGINSQMNAQIVISGAITLTISGAVVYVNNTINGTVSGSTLAIGGFVNFTDNAYYTPMSTGIFNYKANASALVGYVGNGDFNLPYTDYVSLLIRGTGTKYVMANTVLTGQLYINSPGKLEIGTNDFTVTGATDIGSGTLSKNSPTGTLLFIGNANFNTDKIEFNNCDVEFRNGVSLSAGGSISSNFGTGTFKFTTNNQYAGAPYISDYLFGFNILIGSGVSLSIQNGTLYTSGTINGVDSTSILINKSTIKFHNSTAPMVTGKLYCNQAANTFDYSNSGNQDIAVPSDPTPGYKNLTLSGSGLKKLLGDISVKGTYTLTSPATLDTNGYSLTNP